MEQSNLLGPFISYEANGVLGIRYLNGIMAILRVGLPLVFLIDSGVILLLLKMYEFLSGNDWLRNLA